VRAALGPDVAAIMLTNPNTCGLFEREIVEIAKAVHEAGAYFYCDGANFNAIVGKVRPGDLGIDAMHINLHKTFSTPHGGGGPGAGPVVLSAALAPFAPLPFVRKDGDRLTLVEHAGDAGDAQPFGRLTAFHGQMGMYVRALTYMLSHGADGMRQASEDAVLSANYIRASLKDLMSQPFGGPTGDRPCMHEVLFDDAWLKDTGVTTLDFAKAMIDEGSHRILHLPPLPHLQSKRNQRRPVAVVPAPLSRIATVATPEKKRRKRCLDSTRKNSVRIAWTRQPRKGRKAQNLSEFSAWLDRIVGLPQL
jgi:glycine dehydrogenase subunit 2